MNYYEVFWLWISCFGVMYAVLSLLNDIEVYENKPKHIKGLFAISLGSLLFLILSYKLTVH
jgi:hypothetical protein